ncbi:kinesin-like protein KIF20A isoform X2 [Dermacentor albipictus]|uniref:kinesin-like protein KIF20A isoform X2 n=1 Tax=Dermacentor albipictus TaxID=60249 RepID=UPI0031FC6EE2
MHRRAKHTVSAEPSGSASEELPPPLQAERHLDAHLAPSSAVRVYLRIRPRFAGRAFTDPAFNVSDATTVETTTATLIHQQKKRFRFTKVFPECCSQMQLFQEVVRDQLDDFVRGANVLLFAYGPTAGGKTHTVQGPPNDPGLVPRTFEHLFKLIGSRVCKGAPVRPDCFDDVVPLSAEQEASALLRKGRLLDMKAARSATDFSRVASSSSHESLLHSCDSSYDEAQVSLWLSCYEIYKEGIYDLLLPSAEAATKKGGQWRTILKLGEDRAKRAFVRGLVEVPVHSADEAHRLFCLARTNQTIAETRLNRSSSRSHCVFMVRLVTSTSGTENWQVRTMMLCDLAGSERPSKAGTDGSWLREAGCINNSLSVLSRCLEGLRSKDAFKKAPVPFRESKLTQAMQAYFTTGAQVSLVVNICPSMSVFEESLNALKFSAVAIEVVPLQLESRHVRCKEAVRRLSERWNRAMGGDELPDGSLAQNKAEEVAPPAALDAHEAELFETIEALQRDLEDSRCQLKFVQKMAAVSETRANTYKGLMKCMEQELRMLRESAFHALEFRARTASEIAQLKRHSMCGCGHVPNTPA